MMSPSKQLVYKTLLADASREFIVFPVWWFSTGLKEFTFWALGSMKKSVVYFGLDVWIQNLFVPMYGEYSLAGRMISFCVRLVMIIARGFAVVAWSLIACVLLALYIILLPVTIFGIFVQLFGLLA